MKTRFLVMCFLLGGAVAVSAAPGRGPGNANRGAACPSTCDGSGPGQCSPGNRCEPGNPNENCTPQRDGSGKSTAPGKGQKGTGKRATPKG